MYSSRFESALTLAGLRHAGQVRKGTGAPYLVHLVHVAAILARAGYDEDTQIVGILHDLLEDTTSDPRDTAELESLIRHTYGDSVADAVVTLTEPKRGLDGQRLKWRLRKDRYIQQLRDGGPIALRVSAADKLHNLSTLDEELSTEGDTVWRRFNVGPDQTYWFYRAVYETIEQVLNEPLVEAYRRQLQRMDILE